MDDRHRRLAPVAQAWDGVGIWTGLAVGLAIVAVLMLWRWQARERLELHRLEGVGPPV